MILKNSMFQAIIAVFAGGGTGSVLRYLIGAAVDRTTAHIFPFHTLGANILGCFIIGAVFAFFAGKTEFSPNTKLFLTVGFCGGLTTFSTFSYETINLMQSQNYTLACLYVFLSGALCFGAVILGLIAGGAIGRNI